MNQDINDLYDLVYYFKERQYQNEISVAIVSRHAKSYQTTKGFYSPRKTGLMTKKHLLTPLPTALPHCFWPERRFFTRLRGKYSMHL